MIENCETTERSTKLVGGSILREITFGSEQGAVLDRAGRNPGAGNFGFAGIRTFETASSI